MVAQNVPDMLECKAREISTNLSPSFSTSFSPPCSSFDACRAEKDSLRASPPGSLNQTCSVSCLHSEQMAMDDDRSSSDSVQPCLEISCQQEVIGLYFPSYSASPACSSKQTDEQLEGRSSNVGCNTPSQLVLLGNSPVQKESQCVPVLESSEEFTTSRSPLSIAGRASLMRTCKVCGTTKTPLWRSGPQGPKSLCNACGIRFKKARRSQATGDFLDQLQSSPPPIKSYTKLCAEPMKRKIVTDEDDKARKGRCHQRSWPTWMVVSKSSISKAIESSPGKQIPRKRILQMLSASVRRKDSTAMLALLEKQGKITSVFAKDEEEAAVLLMALSCGLVLA